MGRPPALEERHRRLEQAPGDAVVPEIGPHGERTEKAEASPARREVRADDRTVALRAERALGIRAPASAYVVGVATETKRVWKTEKGTEGRAEDIVCGAEVRLS